MLSSPIPRATTRSVTDMNNLQFILGNSVENQITQSRGNNDTHIGIVRDAPDHRIITDLLSSLDQTSDEARRNRGLSWLI